MVVQFRNITTTWHDPIHSWPYEAVVTTMERGLVSDWQPILTEVRQRPFGRVARYIARYAADPDDPRAAAFFTEALRRARAAEEDRERDEVISRIRRALELSELSQADFAREVGTSASRLSTYLSGQVTPSATMLVRIDKAGRR
jgi:ribosome-binding protein aMBF1 (putative translation factor)